MGQEKSGTKSGSFFNLFDWNRKSRKKLFSNGTSSQESSIRAKENGGDLLMSRRQLVDDDEIAGMSSIKGSSNYSCASSVTDDEVAGTRVPGVVARLMGLDSLPVSGVPEPHCTPLFDTRSICDNHSQKKSPEFYMNDKFNNLHHRAEVYSGKMMELRSQKMPSSPIERFQTEMLPRKSAKSLPVTHNKLLSPIKTPGFKSPKNAAHIMEAAAKIIEPGVQVNPRNKAPLFDSSSVPLRLHYPKDSMAVSQRTSRLLESSGRPIESSDFKQLRGQSLNRSWNDSKYTSFSRPMMGLDETTLANARTNRSCTSTEDISSSMCSTGLDESNVSSVRRRGKSVSLAVQAKANVQKREGLSATSTNTLIPKDQDDSKQNQPFRSQSNSQKSKLQKKTSMTNSSGVLRQNNQKQNSLSSRDKLPAKQSSLSHHQGRKALSGDASGMRNKTVNKFTTNTKVGYSKESLETSKLERECFSSNNKDFPCKKRLIERSFTSEKSVFIENVMEDKTGKHVQSNIVIDEHSTWMEDDRRNGTDIVSFTFTSPMIKAVPGQSYSHAAEKRDKKNVYSFNIISENITPKGHVGRSLSLGSNAISGDALSLLLEQKLRALTSGAEPSYNSSEEAGLKAASASMLEWSVSAFDYSGKSLAEHENEFSQRSSKVKLDFVFASEKSSNKGQVHGMSHKLLEAKGLECNSSSGAHKALGHQHPSPLSALEASFSNESCNSSESSFSMGGRKMTSVQGQNITSLNNIYQMPSTESEIDLSDSASSDFKETTEEQHTSNVHLHDLNYIRDILFSTWSMFKELGLCFVAHVGEALDPHLYDKLENRSKSAAESNAKEGRLRRKVLFDCVNECLGSKCSFYFRAGYRAWAKGVAVIGKELAEDLYGEITGWRSMGDWMVDELVEKDMSSHLGRWIDFEIEAFEAGVGIEKGILDSLVDELVGDVTSHSSISLAA